MNRSDDLKHPTSPRPKAKSATKPASQMTGSASAKGRTGRNPRAAAGASLQKTRATKTDKFVLPKSASKMTAASLLGVSANRTRARLSAMEMVSMIRNGVSSAAVDTLTGFLNISQVELSEALDIPLRTLVRRKGVDLLPSDESAKLIRVARVIERAEEVFEDPVAARQWLKSANASLDGETPMSLLDTEIGAEAVMDTLGRIEHGVFA